MKYQPAKWKNDLTPGIWELISPQKGQTLILIGQIHGNELTGFKVIQCLLKMKKKLAQSMRGGRLILIHGNPAAAKANLRFTKGGIDLNRAWLTPREIKKQCTARDSYEWKRLEEIKPYLRADKNTISLDIHSSSSRTKPFLLLPVINKQYCWWIRRLGVPIASFGWNNQFTRGQSTLEWVYMQGGVGMGVECGQHTDPQTVKNAWRVASNFLATAFTCFPMPTLSRPTIFKIKKTIPYIEQFKWKKKNIVGPVHLKKGERFGMSPKGGVYSQDEGYLFLPNAHPEPANPDIGYLANKNVK